ncbi:MAG: hypothetical protein RIB93_31745 [Coleofasciculus sp. D1-CHI-01]|uniref:hypothetical protein n=1 Tax=Coleofasciculus sp. D1-CHI-01 TaxID=3068482 RepID=UPI0032F0DD4D
MLQFEQLDRKFTTFILQVGAEIALHPVDSPNRVNSSPNLKHQALTKLPEKGLFRAVATAAREPISHTIVRGLLRGSETFWSSPAQRKAQAFEMTGNDQQCWVQGEAERIGHITDFNAKLSDLCDRVLWSGNVSSEHCEVLPNSYSAKRCNKVK